MISIRKIVILGLVSLLALSIGVAASSSALAQSATQPAATMDATQPSFTAFAGIKWQPCAGLPGCDMVVAHGDLQAASQTYWRLQPKVATPAHWNTTPEHIVGIAGEMQFTDGDGNQQSIKPGDYLYSPSHQVKTFTCVSKEACVIFDYEELPFDFNVAK